MNGRGTRLPDRYPGQLQKGNPWQSGTACRVTERETGSVGAETISPSGSSTTTWSLVVSASGSSPRTH